MGTTRGWRHWPGPLALAGVVAVTLSGCAPQVIGDEYDAPGPGVGSDGSIDTRPVVGWVEPGARFFVTTYGSSSCPTAPTAVSVSDDGRGLDVAMRRTGGNACTADLGPASYALDLPAGFRPLKAFVVSLHLEDDDRVVRRTLRR